MTEDSGPYADMPARPAGAWSRHGTIYSNANMRFQSFFMLITVQPFFLASS